MMPEHRFRQATAGRGGSGWVRATLAAHQHYSTMSRHILFDSDHNPAMRFEGLARAAFDDCGKYGGPFRIANQEVFGFKRPDHTEITDEFRRALILVLVKLVISHPDNETFKELEERAWTAKSPEEVDEIIQSASQIYMSLD